MEASKLKNIVVLNNLPSNIVDEAIIVLKSSKKIKNLQKVEQNKKNINKETGKKDKDYILKEAEMLVNSYVSKIESKDKRKKGEIELKQKYEKVKKYSILATIIIAIETIAIIL